MLVQWKQPFLKCNVRSYLSEANVDWEKILIITISSAKRAQSYARCKMPTGGVLLQDTLAPFAPLHVVVYPSPCLL